MMAVTLSENDGVLKAAIDNPPVNALSQPVRAGLAEALLRLEDDVTLRGMVITSAAPPFSAGADVREFGASPQPPHLPDLCLAIESASKPVAAAIVRYALGGGLELALAADWRAATPGARLGLPEVELGLIPGAGGTQRLPRVAGSDAALSMIVGGKPIDAEAAQEAAIVDMVDADPVAAAASLLVRGKRTRNTHASPPGPSKLDELEALIARKYRLEPARRAALEAVLAASRTALSDGLAEERRIFLDLKASPQSLGLRHAFRAEREATRLPSRLKGAGTRSVESAVVVGAGAMGRGIGYALARAGIPVTITDTSRTAAERARGEIAAIRDTDVARGRLSAEAGAALADRLAFDTALPARADLYVEAVFEDPGVKRDVLGAMAEAGGPEAILATNTSYLDIDSLAEDIPQPERVLGLHFFNPAHVMRLLEVVEAARTAPDVVATGFALARRLGKMPVRASVAFGFIGNRIFQAYQREAGLMLLEGASVDAIDRALTDFGMPMGIFETLDLAGLQVGTSMRRTRDPGDYDTRAFAVHDSLSGEGRTGRRAGEGFYSYAAARAEPSSRVGELAAHHAAEFGIPRRTIDADEVVSRCILAMGVEGLRAVADRIADSEEAVDAVMLHGYGFPRVRGGPIFHARQVGLETVRRWIDAILAETAARAEDWALPSA